MTKQTKNNTNKQVENIIKTAELTVEAIENELKLLSASIEGLNAYINLQDKRISQLEEQLG